MCVYVIFFSSFLFYLFIKMEVVSWGELKLTVGNPGPLSSICGDLRATRGLSMICASGEQKVVNFGLRLRGRAVFWGCWGCWEVVEAVGESNCVSLLLLMLGVPSVLMEAAWPPDLSEAAFWRCSRQLEPPVCFSSTFGRWWWGCGGCWRLGG